MKKFPQTLVVKREQEGDGEYYLADLNVEAHAEMGVKTKVGIYELKEVAEIEGVVHVNKTGY